jgi:hypothetical protein
MPRDTSPRTLWSCSRKNPNYKIDGTGFRGEEWPFMIRCLPPLILIAGFGALLIGGCADGKKAPGGAYVVSAATSPFYKYGPSQGSGPDQMLSQGQHVTLVSRQYGYSRVTTDAGLSGYVRDGDISPVPTAPSPKVAAVSSRSAAQKKSAAREQAGTDPVLLLNGTDASVSQPPLPVKSNPSGAAPTPGPKGLPSPSAGTPHPPPAFRF